MNNNPVLPAVPAVAAAELGFPRSHPVNLASRRLFSLAYQASPVSASDLAFSTLFGWEDCFHYRVSCCNDFLMVYYNRSGQTVLLPPLLLNGRLEDGSWVPAFRQAVERLRAHFRGEGTELVLELFPAVYTRHLPPDQWRVLPQRDVFDYVYRRDDLCTLPGQKFSAKRNLIRQFMRGYRYRYEPLTAETVPHYREFVRQWKEGGQGLAVSEPRMLDRLLDHFAALKLCGGLLYAEDRIVAATLGTVVERFSYEDGIFPTAVVHSERALVEYKGAYQMINQLFCAQLPASVVYVNREEDLGVPGLRKAKMSYAPARFIEKSTVVPRF